MPLPTRSCTGQSLCHHVACAPLFGDFGLDPSVDNWLLMAALTRLLAVRVTHYYDVCASWTHAWERFWLKKGRTSGFVHGYGRVLAVPPWKCFFAWARLGCPEGRGFCAFVDPAPPHLPRGRGARGNALRRRQPAAGSSWPRAVLRLLGVVLLGLFRGGRSLGAPCGVGCPLAPRPLQPRPSRCDPRERPRGSRCHGCPRRTC